MENTLIETNGKRICWKKLSSKDKDEVIRLVHEEVAKRDPIVVSLLNYFKNKEDVLSLSVFLALVTLDDNHSVGVYDATDPDKLIGFLLMSLHSAENKRDYVNYLDEATTKNPVFLLGTRFFAVFDESLDKHVNRDKFMAIKMSVVQENYSRIGIMTQLWKIAETLLKEEKVRYLTSECSSNYTQRIAIKLGHEELQEVRYEEYVDVETGDRLFEHAPPPHETVKLMVLDIETK